MIQTLTVEDCLKQIHQAKCNNRRTCKIKVMQVEYFDDKRPKIYLQTLDTQKVMKELEEKGYHCELDKNDKQVTVGYDLTGKINKCQQRKLHTTTLIIKW